MAGLFGIRLCSSIFIKSFDEIWTPDATQALFDTAALLRLVPEEVLPLGKFLALAFSAEDGFERIGVIACIPCFGGIGHRRGCKVLYLLQMEVEMLGDDCQFSHILLTAAGVTADEVGNDLLAEVLFAVDAVKHPLELIELLERGLPHQIEHTVAGMLRGHLQTTADMTADELAGIFLSSTVGGLVLAAVDKQVVADAATDEAALDTGQTVDSMVNVEQTAVVGIKVRTDLRMDATGTATLLTGIKVTAVHAVHIGRWTAEVGEVTLEVGHLDHLFHLF